MDDIEDRIDELLESEFIDQMSKLKISNETSKKLFNYQEKHLLILMLSVLNNLTTLDGSETGTGKTYCASALCYEMKLQPLIICPKTVIYNWKKVAKIFNIEPLDIVNYESIRTGTTPYAKLVENVIIERNKKKTIKTFKWNLPKNTIIIFDEAHRCKNMNTLNACLLKSAYEQRIKSMILSASMSDELKYFELFGYVLNLYSNIRQAKTWIKGIISEDKRLFNPKHSTIYKKIFPLHGSKMAINELGSEFPKNQIISECIEIDKHTTNKINEFYDTLTKKWTISQNYNSILEQSVKMRMEIELIKAKNYLESINDYIEERYSVAIFVNFNDTRTYLMESLKTNCVVYGEQTSEIREKNIEEFQQNKSNIIIINIKSGGVGLSLHDIHGNHPRISIIFPNYSSIDLSQALGRIHRVGAKTPALQRIIFLANTCEEDMADKLNEKFKFSQKFSSEHLLPFQLKLD
jgi:superfamily II DNA or RNA helicase